MTHENGHEGPVAAPLPRGVPPSLFLLLLRQARKVVVLVVGFTVVLFGCILFFTPGPAIVVIPIGFMILGLEFAWARRWIRKSRVWMGRMVKPRRKGRRWRKGGFSRPEKNLQDD